MQAKQILVTGACGQLGSELTAELRDTYGASRVVATDIHDAPETVGEPYEPVDVTSRAEIEAVVREYDVDAIFHLAVILSADGEEDPQRAYAVNVNGLYNVLEVARNAGVTDVVVPSSIAVFGPETPDQPPERTILDPNTMYGISKVLTEQLGQYYHDRYGLDVRGVRFPGIISHRTRPSGGTTDYAVDVFYRALKDGAYTYFVRPDTTLPMIYMPDAITALVDLFEADGDDLRHRTRYNVGSLSFSAAELTEEIQRQWRPFDVSYEPDHRQAIADSWPTSLDDSAAREDWGWSPDYGRREMVADVLEHLQPSSFELEVEDD